MPVNAPMYNSSVDDASTEQIQKQKLQQRSPRPLRDGPPQTMGLSQWIDLNQFNPSVQFIYTILSYEYRPSDPYRVFMIGSNMTVKFNVPPAVRDYPVGNMYVHLYHCSTSSNGTIDMRINSTLFLEAYSGAPKANFGVQTFVIPYSTMSLDGQNIFEVALNTASPGKYWLSDVSFSFEDASHTMKFGQTYHGETNTTGAVYNQVAITDSYRRGNPYLLFESAQSVCSVEFCMPKEFVDLTDGVVTLAINHCATSAGGVVDMLLNGKPYRLQYADAPKSNFGIQTFDIPFSSIQTKGEMNTFQIQLHVGTGSNAHYYWLSDVGITFAAKSPEVTYTTWESSVKQWILHQRVNISELSQIPRDDLDAWEFVKNAPGWFFLPFIKASPAELMVLIKHFPTSFIAVGYNNWQIMRQAQDFHRELIHTDIPKKNALRHAYWMCLLTRKYGADFAIDIGDAHEYTHVDLTIEGPYDHVTDKINNAVGVEMSYHDKQTDCAALVENAWANNQLAWAKNFRVDSAGKQTADIFWQTPLDKLHSIYQVTPDLNSLEKTTLAKHGVAIPGDPPIHDEL